MESMTLELTVVGANNLKDVSMFSKMDAYAVVSISADPRSAQKTPSDKEGGKNPRWEHPMKFAVDANAARTHHIALVFKLRCNRSFGDSNIGEVRVPIRELIDEEAQSPVPHAEGRGVGRTAMYLVRTPSGRSKGQLEFEYKFTCDSEAGSRSPSPVPKNENNQGRISCPSPASEQKNVDEPPVAYPPFVYPPMGCPSPTSSHPQAIPGPYPGHHGYNNHYQPSHTGYMYPPHPQLSRGPGNGYPPQQHAQLAGYGAPYGHGHKQPPVQLQILPQKKGKKGSKNKKMLGMGLGLGMAGGMAVGLTGGFLGGLAADNVVDGAVDGVVDGVAGNAADVLNSIDPISNMNNIADMGSNLANFGLDLF